MAFLKILQWSVYAGLWSYGLADTLFPNYRYFKVSALYGPGQQTAVKDVQLFNTTAFQFAVAIFVLMGVVLFLRRAIDRHNDKESSKLLVDLTRQG